MTKSQKQEGREGRREGKRERRRRKKGKGKDAARLRKLKARDLELAGETRPCC